MILHNTHFSGDWQVQYTTHILSFLFHQLNSRQGKEGAKESTNASILTSKEAIMQKWRHVKINIFTCYLI